MKLRKSERISEFNMFLIKRCRAGPAMLLLRLGERGGSGGGKVPFFFMNETRRRRRAPTDAFTRRNKRRDRRCFSRLRKIIIISHACQLWARRTCLISARITGTCAPGVPTRAAVIHKKCAEPSSTARCPAADPPRAQLFSMEHICPARSPPHNDVDVTFLSHYPTHQ